MPTSTKLEERSRNGGARLPSWLLIVATAAICVATLKLESADLFPMWRFAAQWSPAALPSSRAVPLVEISSGLPVLSLSLKEGDLHDPATGLLLNKMKHGEEWEREGSVSYFDGGKLVFATGVGVRIHGGSSRHVAPRPGFRLYFRRQYGLRELPRGVLFSQDAQPIRRLIVHDDFRREWGVDWYFVNPFAYDIARKMGAIAPETKPVRFFVNGEYYGPFVLTERFDERYFAAHFGYEDVLLSQEEMNKLFDWMVRNRPLTMKSVSEQVNIDNLTRWFLAVLFCATRDPYQGPGQYLDQTKQTGGWFWVNWDMDQSFRSWNLDSYQYILERVGEGRRGRNRAEPRAFLLTHLIAEDPEYRDYFKRTAQRILNHHVTDAFLMQRYDHYLDTATKLGVTRLDYLVRLRDFLERRRAFFWLTTEQWLNTAPRQPVAIVAPPNVHVTIEGDRVESGHRELYFPDVQLTVDVADENRAAFSEWRINGRAVRGASRLTFTPDRPTKIVAVFNNTPAPGSENAADAPNPSPPPLPPTVPAPPAIVWKKIPAGTFWMGCVPGDTRCSEAERPRVQRTIAEPFEMMSAEVTAGDFGAFAAATSRHMPRQPEWYANDRHPVVNVTWDEAQAYCEWTGGRLPTEEEWEHAARGGFDAALFPWGDVFTGQANARHNLKAERWEFTAPVSSFLPNGFGLHDMAGNVWEWTASEFRPTHQSDPAHERYDLWTVKGGSWDNIIRHIRVSERAALSRGGRHNLYVGFRCVRPPQK
jgi:formylglycine-generating enzyme required for sulfatase activity